MGAIDEVRGEDRERSKNSRKVQDVLSAVVLNKIGAPRREVLAIEDDFWPERQTTARSIRAHDAVDGTSRPSFTASAPTDVKYDPTLSSSTEQGVSSESLATASIDNCFQQQTGSSKAADADVKGMGSSIIVQHSVCKTAAGPSVLANNGDPISNKTGRARVSFKQTSTGGMDSALPTSQSTSEDDQVNGAALDERRQKRMLSNRESARRSRLRKQQHLDELRAEVDQLQAEKTTMVANYNAAAQQFSHLTSENNALRKHAEDLYQKIMNLKANNDFASSNWWRALDIENGTQENFAPDHLSVYLQPASRVALP